MDAALGPKEAGQGAAASGVPVELACGDGQVLLGSLFEPFGHGQAGDGPAPCVRRRAPSSLPCATGVTARYYHRYAVFLAANGFSALTFDYRLPRHRRIRARNLARIRGPLARLGPRRHRRGNRLGTRTRQGRADVLRGAQLRRLRRRPGRGVQAAHAHPDSRCPARPLAGLRGGAPCAIPSEMARGHATAHAGPSDSSRASAAAGSRTCPAALPLTGRAAAGTSRGTQRPPGGTRCAPPSIKCVRQFLRCPPPTIPTPPAGRWSGHWPTPRTRNPWSAGSNPVITDMTRSAISASSTTRMLTLSGARPCPGWNTASTHGPWKRPLRVTDESLTAHRARCERPHRRYWGDRAHTY